MKVTTKKRLVFGIGGALIVVGCVLGGAWTKIFNSIFESSIALTPTSTSYDIWKDIPIPMYLDVHLWHWTNPEEVLNPPSGQTVKPHFEEYGPYVFSEVHNKVNITFNKNATVTFLQERWWKFVPEQSNGTLDDMITTVNVIASTVAYAVRNQSPAIKLIVDYVMEKLEPGVYVTKPAREWLFDGYQDKLLDFASKLNLTIKLPFKKFGWFVERNGDPNYDGAFTMHTGTDDIKKLGDMAEWKYKDETSAYQPPCSKISGGLGELGPPMTDVETVSIFAPDFCTAFELHRAGDVEKQGVVGNKYIGTISQFDNGFTLPEKKCYCSVENGEQKCELPGLMNVNKCKFGAPVFVSYPHFYLAHDDYRNKITGMAPDKEKHEFYFGVEPMSGIPLTVQAHLQISVKLEPYPGIAMFANVPTLFIPAIWFTQRVDLPDDKIGLLKILVKIPAIGMGTFFGIAGIGVLMVIIGVVLTVRNGWKGDEGEQLVSTN